MTIYKIIDIVYIPDWMKSDVYIGTMIASKMYQDMVLKKGENRVVYMQQVFVKFDDVDQVRNFVNAVSTVEANFELGSGRRVVDPKSILGVFALDLARPQRLVCDSDDSAMLDKISPYLLQGTAC